MCCAYAAVATLAQLTSNPNTTYLATTYCF